MLVCSPVFTLPHAEKLFYDFSSCGDSEKDRGCAARKLADFAAGAQRKKKYIDSCCRFYLLRYASARLYLLKTNAAI